jgi:hypothetical protein
MANQYAIYMHFYVGKILSLQKAGVTNLPLLEESRPRDSGITWELLRII